MTQASRFISCSKGIDWIHIKRMEASPVYRFNKWIDSLILALISGGVYLTMSSIYDVPVKWENAFVIAVATFITWTFIAPRFFHKNEAKK